MQRKQFEDPVVLFASTPELKELCSITARVESGTTIVGNVTTQPKILKCRELIFTEPDIIATPSYEQYDCFTVVMTQTLYTTGRVQARMRKNGLQLSKPIKVHPGLYQACLRYTLLARLAPAWNKTDDWLIQGRDFLSHTGCANAVKCELMVLTDQLYLSMCASVLRLAPLQLVDLNLSELELQSLLYNAEHRNGELSLHNSWCRVIPSMKKGRLCSISLSIPEGSPFTSYRDLKRHWKNTYGFRLPETDDDIFYGQISFCGIGGKQFTYPSICLRAEPLQCVPRVDAKPILSAFLQDLHSKLSSACGHTLRFQPQVRYPVSAVYAASQDIKGPGANLGKRSSTYNSQLPLRNPRDLIQMKAASQPVSRPTQVNVLKASAVRPPRVDERTPQASQPFSQTQNMASLSRSQASQPMSQTQNTSLLSSQAFQPLSQSISQIQNNIASGPRSQIAQPTTQSALSASRSQASQPSSMPQTVASKMGSERRGTWSQMRRSSASSGLQTPQHLPRTWTEHSSSFMESRSDNSVTTPPTERTSTTVFSAASSCVSNTTKAMATPRGSSAPHTPGSKVHRTSLSLHKTHCESAAHMPVVNDKEPSRNPPPVFAEDNTPRRESKEYDLARVSGSRASTSHIFMSQSQAFMSESQTFISNSQTFTLESAIFSQQEQTGTMGSTPTNSATDSTAPTGHNDFEAESSQTEPTGSRKIIPVFRRKTLSGSDAKKKSVGDTGRAETGFGQRAEGAARIVPAFKPKNKSAAPRPLGQLGQKACSSYKDTSQIVSCPQVTSSTEDSYPSSTQPSFQAPKHPMFFAKKIQPAKNLKSPSIKSPICQASRTKMPVSGKLKKKMLESSNSKTMPSAHTGGMKNVKESPRPNVHQSAVTPPLGSAFSQALQNSCRDCIALIPNISGSQGKRKMDGASVDGWGGEKKARSKPQVQDLDVEVLARSNQLQKANAVTLTRWLKARGVHCKAKDKKADLVDKVKVFLAITTLEP